MLSYEQFSNSYSKLLSYFTEGLYQEELHLAKKDFFTNAGIVDETKPNYALRMNQFFDWYFLTRKLTSHMQTPLSVASEQRDLRLTDEDVATLTVLSQHQHSLYEFVKRKGDVIILKDLFSGKKIEILAGDQIFNFDPKETFEARVIELEKHNHFMKGFCFHPESALKYILEEIKIFKKNPDLDFRDFLLRLNRMRYKLEQYRHIKPELIYTNENKLRL